MEFTAQQIEQMIARNSYNTVNDLSFNLGRLLMRTSETLEVVDICVTYGVAIAHKNMLFDLPQRLQDNLLAYAKAWVTDICNGEDLPEPQWTKDLCLNHLMEIIDHFEPAEANEMDL
jgi:hypothetical protein